MTQKIKTAAEIMDKALSLMEKALKVESIYEQKECVNSGPLKLFLPGLTADKRAMPNHIARSSLFAPVAAGRKKIHKEVVLTSRADASIKFSGEQLDESQADVWLQAIYDVVNKGKLGEPVSINRADFLKAIGRGTAGDNYKWLHSAFKALSFAMIIIEINASNAAKNMSIGKTSALHLISGFDYCDKSESYTFTIDKRWGLLFKHREYALIDWNKRLLIGRNQNTSKSLQRLLATSSNKEQKYSIEWLKNKLEYNGRQRDFIDSINNSLKELKRVDIIKHGAIETSSKNNMQVVFIVS